MQPELIGGRYRVVAPAGRGGMGTVWRCQDERLSREVAVKQVGLLPGQSATDSARAFREARSSAGLNHRNVVAVFDVVEQDDLIWLVMEHVPGRALSQVLRDDGPLDPRSVARIGAQVAEGLAAAHAAGISHRDVKPGNVLVRDDGAVKISDFGIARTHGDPALTQSGFVTGTPTYFSPQLARGGDPGPADDVWALGATLFFAVEGHPLVDQHANPVAILHDIASGRRRTTERAGFLQEALDGMLAPEAEDRWSMAAAARRLSALATRREGDSLLLTTRELAPASPAAGTSPPEPARTEPVGSEPVGSEPVGSEPVRSEPVRSERVRPVPKTRRRRRWPLAAVAVVALLLGGLVWALNRPDSNTGNRPGAATTPSASPSTSAKADDSPSATPEDGGTIAAGQEGEPAAMETFVRDYYAAAPGGSDEAWAMLGPGEKEQGRGAYDGFWRTISSVDVTSAQARPGSKTVDVTLVYRTTGGGTSTERKVEELVSDGDGGYLLQSDTPAG